MPANKISPYGRNDMDGGDTPSNEWPMAPFEQVAKPQSDRGRRIKQRDYLPEGRIPVIDQGQAPIGGYTNDENFVFTGQLPVVLFGDHTRAVKLVNHRFAVGADGIKIFSPAEGVRPKYLYYWMKSAPIPDRGYGRHYQYLRQLFVPLPSQAKQDEIVAEIEKQFSRLDEAVANLKLVKANIKRYKAAVLKAAVEGRLVETEAELARKRTPSPRAGEGGGEGAGYETGAQLLQRILETRRSQWQGKGKYKEPATPDTTDLPELPEGWVWATAEQLTDESRAITYGVIKLGEQVDVGIPVLRSSDVRPLRIDLDNVKKIAPEIASNYRRTFLRGGEVVMTVRGTLGGIAVVPPQCSGFNVSREVAMLALVEPAMAHLVAFFIASAPLENWLLSRAKGIAYTGINIETLKALPIPLPPVAEQHRIVAEVDRHLSLANEAEAQVNANLQRAERLKQSILQSAFTGDFSYGEDQQSS